MVLAPKYRDITVFITPLRLLRITTLLIRATNLVAQFVRVVIRILNNLFLIIVMPFVDNIRVKGPYTNYSNKEALPRIRQYIYKYILNLNKTID